MRAVILGVAILPLWIVCEVCDDGEGCWNDGRV